MPNVTKQDLENAMNELRFGLVNLKVDSKQIKEIVGRIEGRLDSFKEDVTKTLKFQAGVEFLNAANASVNNIAGAIYASRRGDQMGVASNSLSAIGTITKGVAAAVLALGPEAFPIALAIFFVGALIDLVGGILAVLPKDEKALVEQIKALLIHERSKELHDQLVVAFNEFEDWEELLGVGTFTAQSWRDLMNQYHLKTGEAVHFCDISAQWLLNAENQDEPASWVDVFEAYAMSMYLRSMIYFKQYASWRDYWEAEMPKADKERQKTLAQIEQEAQTEMRQYFENNVLTTFHTLGWVGRRMAPIWQRGTRDHTWTASVSFMGPGAVPALPIRNGMTSASTCLISLRFCRETKGPRAAKCSGLGRTTRSCRTMRSTATGGRSADLEIASISQAWTSRFSATRNRPHPASPGAALMCCWHCRRERTSSI